MDSRSLGYLAELLDNSLTTLKSLRIETLNHGSEGGLCVNKLVNQLGLISAKANKIEYLELDFEFTADCEPGSWWYRLDNMLCKPDGWPALKRVSIGLSYSLRTPSLRTLESDSWKHLPDEALAGISSSKVIDLKYHLPSLTCP